MAHTPLILAIKKYQPEDLDAMMALWRASTVLAHDFQSADELDRDEDLIRNKYIAQTETWVAWEGEQMVGFISLVGTLIVALFVDASRHRAGIGSALLAHVISLHGPLGVEVFPENTNGVAFYQKHGFKKVREEKNALYPGHPHWIMEQKPK